MRTSASIVASLILLCCVAAGIAQAADSGSAVTYTRVADEVKGLTKLGIVHGKSSMVFGSQSRLRTKAIAEAQAEAAKLGATTILITVDNFEATPINNVAIEAVAYGPAKDGSAPAVAPKEEKNEAASAAAVTPTTPGKVEYTRNSNDVAGKTKLGIVHGRASKVFGGQAGLRARAIAEAQAEAAKLGATIILITVDDFEATPINNVAVEAVAYK